MSQLTDMIMLILLFGGAYYLITSGKLNEILQGANLPALPFGPSGGGASKHGVVTGTKIYPDANPPHQSGVTGGGDVEHHGYASGGSSDRHEWEITTPHLNCEVTAYFNVTEPKEDTISIKLRGPKHSDPVPDSDQCNNIHYIPFSGKGKVMGNQCPHTNYKDCPATPLFNLGNIRNKWIGVKAIEWNEDGGVHAQTWVDPNANGRWKLWADMTNTCFFNKSPPKGSHPVTVLLRVDTSKVEARDISLREITPPSQAKKSAYANSYIAKRYYSPHTLTRLSNA